KRRCSAGSLLPILLDARGAQAGEPMLVDGELPGEEFLDRQRIAAAGLFERQQAAADRGHDLGLAPDDPALGSRGGQIRNGQRAAVGPDDVFDPRAMGLGHWKYSRKTMNATCALHGLRLKICLNGYRCTGFRSFPAPSSTPIVR